MFHRALIVFILFLSFTVTVSASKEALREMTEKYGPIPKAILEPELGPEEEYRQQYPISERIMVFLRLKQRARKGSRVKQCFANQRVVLGAIEMYNMDVNEMYTELGPVDLVDPESSLLKGGYLKYKIVNVDDKCVLRSYGDVSKEGVIYCEYHGALTDICDELRNLSGYKPQLKIMQRGWVFFIPAGIFCVGLLLLAFRFAGFSKKDS